MVITKRNEMQVHFVYLNGYPSWH